MRRPSPGETKPSGSVKKFISWLAKWSRRLIHFPSKEIRPTQSADPARASRQETNSPEILGEETTIGCKIEEGADSEYTIPSGQLEIADVPSISSHDAEHIENEHPHGPQIVQTSGSALREQSTSLHAENTATTTNEQRNRKRSSKKPSEIDMRYIIPPDQFPPQLGQNSREHLLAPVSPAQRTTPEPQGDDIVRDEMAAMAPDVMEDGCFRQIHIRYGPRSDEVKARTQYIMHDTGAGCSLSFENKVNALDLHIMRSDNMRTYHSVTGAPLTPIGRARINFSYVGIPENIYEADLLILSEPTDGMVPAYDILLGRDVIKVIKAIKWDYKIIGHSTVE